MKSIGELNREMDGLEEEARHVLANSEMTVFERRQALDKLLRRYHVLEDYRRALAAYIRRMKWADGRTVENPEDVIADMLASPEFALLNAVVFAMLVAAVYGGGPRSALVPVMLLTPTMTPAPAFFP